MSMRHYGEGLTYWRLRGRGERRLYPTFCNPDRIESRLCCGIRTASPKCGAIQICNWTFASCRVCGCNSVVARSSREGARLRVVTDARAAFRASALLLISETSVIRLNGRMQGDSSPPASTNCSGERRAVFRTEGRVGDPPMSGGNAVPASPRPLAATAKKSIKQAENDPFISIVHTVAFGWCQSLGLPVPWRVCDPVAGAAF